MSLIMEGTLKDFADEDRRERLTYMQDQQGIGFWLWVLMILASGVCWGLALSAGRWIWRLL